MGQERTGFSRVLLSTLENHQGRVFVPHMSDRNGFSGWEKGNHFELLVVAKGSFHFLDAKMQALDKLFGGDGLVRCARFKQRDMAVRNKSQNTHNLKDVADLIDKCVLIDTTEGDCGILAQLESGFLKTARDEQVERNASSDRLFPFVHDVRTHERIF